MTKDTWSKSIVLGFFDSAKTILDSVIFNDILSEKIMEVPYKKWDSVILETLNEMKEKQ